MPNIIIGKEEAFNKGFFFVDEGIDLTNASFSGTSFDVSSEDGGPSGINFNDDGTKMFIVGVLNDKVYEYDLATGFDISTASYSGTSFYVGGQDSRPRGVKFNGDGTKMFMVGANNIGVIYEYDLSTGFDLSTVSLSQSFDVNSESEAPNGVQFNGDGTKMFVAGVNVGVIYEYDLTTGFDLSTASYSGTSFDVSSEDRNPQGVSFNDDSSKMLVAGFNNSNVYEYTL